MLGNTLRLNFSCFNIIHNHSKIIGHILKKSKIISVESSRPRVFCRKGVLRNFTKFTRKIKCEGLLFNKIAGSRPPTLLKKETLAQTFSCEFCEIFTNIFFTEYLWWLLLNGVVPRTLLNICDGTIINV